MAAVVSGGAVLRAATKDDLVAMMGRFPVPQLSHLGGRTLGARQRGGSRVLSALIDLGPAALRVDQCSLFVSADNQPAARPYK